MAASLFGIGVLILATGFVWFWIVRPILEGCGIIRDVNDSLEESPALMSRVKESAPVEPLSSKDGQSDGRTDSLLYERGELLMFYKLLRKYGVAREEARPVLKAMRIPLSNDVWADAAPPEVAHVTPIVGRPTNARFETDPDFPYQAPA